MGLITKEVEIGLKNQTIKWYENKGYNIPRRKNINGKYTMKIGTKIKVKVEDLTFKSGALVDVKCDGCGKELIGMKWVDYKRYVHKDGKYYCNKCAQAGFKQWVSFYDWCYLNLSKDEADKIMLRWDYKLNISKKGKILTPKDITHGSNGLNAKGYWFKCLDHPEHESEQKNINGFTNLIINNISCAQCNSISITHPHLIKYLINKKDALKYSRGSNKKVPMKCPECGHEKKINFNNLINSGFGCPSCSDHIPFTEKFLFNFLEQLKKNFQIQLTKITFKWCNSYRYDFYINDINCIIETHGLQHYEEKRGNWGDLAEIQKNDKDKEELAKENNIENYIILDCRYSELDWIKSSIMKSKLPQLLNFKENDIDWFKCYEYACSNLVKTICDLWNSEKNIVRIVEKLKLCRSTIRKYLKQGAKLNWCNYDPIKEIHKIKY
jgi:ribosomal protein S27E